MPDSIYKVGLPI